MESEVEKYLKKHIPLEGNKSIDDTLIPYHKVVNLLEAFNAIEAKKIMDNNQLMLPSDKDIEDYAIYETINKPVNNDKGIGEVYMLKIGVEFGAKWLRDLVKKSKVKCQ